MARKRKPKQRKERKRNAASTAVRRSPGAPTGAHSPASATRDSPAPGSATATVPPPTLQATYITRLDGGRFFLWGVARATEARSLLARWGGQRKLSLVPAEERLALPVSDNGEPPLTAPIAVEGWAVELTQALAALQGVRIPDGAADADPPAASVAVWAAASRFVLDLVARHRMAPRWRPMPDDVLAARASRRRSGSALWRRLADGAYEGLWTALPDLPGDRARFQALTDAMSPAAHCAVGADPAGDAHWPAEAALRVFLDDAVDALVRAALKSNEPELPGAGWESLWLPMLWHPRANAALPLRPADRHLPSELERWVAPLRAGDFDGASVCLKLEPPRESAQSGKRQPGGRWRITPILQAADDPQVSITAAQALAAGDAPIPVAGRVFRDARRRLERALADANAVSAGLSPLRDAPDEPLELGDDDAAAFLTEVAPELRARGIEVLLPAELQDSVRPRLRLRLTTGTGSKGSTPASADSDDVSATAPSTWASLAELARFKWEITLGDAAVTPAAFRRLVAQRRPLVRWRERWVRLDPAETEPLVERLARVAPRPAAATVLAAALAGELEVKGAAMPVASDDAVAAVIVALRAGAGALRPLVEPPGFRGELRPYQARGAGWLAALADHGLGGILADDMGLGKTVQLIALVAHERATRPDVTAPTLVVCPASVLGNWERELARFAPELPRIRHHGPERAATPEDLARATPEGAVILTTYGTLRRDAALTATEWDRVVLDEAQQIKNPDTAQTRAARRLQARQRLALTGTPVENRLLDLWSLIEFTNPGLLGSRQRFRREFADAIEATNGAGHAADRLQRLTSPFVLRRLKSDPAVAVDLPPRLEFDLLCTLSAEQAALYKAVLDETLDEVSDTSGMQRRGLVLALLTRLKQVVNHPAHYLGDHSPLPGRSGKLDRLTEMMEELASTGDHALIFTQYRVMGDLLVQHLTELLGSPVPFLHGGVSATQRTEMVRRFQEDDDAPAAFILSLRAGGLGLNLTRAAHVFLFDRWWNPAVEDQAADRAHRIGQDQTVHVHRMLTLGTLEERIAGMLRSKRELAEAAVRTGEAWITELDDHELRELVELAADATVMIDDQT